MLPESRIGSLTCLKCRRALSLSLFVIDKRTGGLRPRCRYCRTEDARRVRNNEAIRAASARWRAAHPERASLATRTWYRKNRQKARQHAERKRRDALEYYAAKEAKRRAIKRCAVPRWANLEAILAIYKNARLLTKQTGVQHDVDHIVPLKSNLVCGLHCEANLRVIPQLENIAKGNRYWPEMP